MTARGLVLLMTFLLGIGLVASEWIRHPVVIIPGFSGSILEGKITSENITHSLPWYCKYSLHKWFRLWVSLTEVLIFPECFESFLSHAWVDGKWQPASGVDIRVAGASFGDLYPIANLDPGVPHHEATYFEALINTLTMAGYHPDQDLFGAAYAWRDPSATDAWIEQTAMLIVRA